MKLLEIDGEVSKRAGGGRHLDAGELADSARWGAAKARVQASLALSRASKLPLEVAGCSARLEAVQVYEGALLKVLDRLGGRLAESGGSKEPVAEPERMRNFAPPPAAPVNWMTLASKGISQPAPSSS